MARRFPRLSRIQAVALYNVAAGRLPWERVRSAFKAPMTGDALLDKGFLRHSNGVYMLTQLGRDWVRLHPPSKRLVKALQLPTIQIEENGTANEVA